MSRSQRSQGGAEQHERFARAVDHLLVSQSEQPLQPPRAASFAEELAVLGALREHAMTLAPAPTEQERARMRSRVVAAATGEHTVLRQPPSPGPRTDQRRPPVPSKRADGIRRRFSTAVAAVFCLLVALSGLSLLMSKDALPGDPLYGIKRSIENASLGLTFGEQARGLKDLSMAGDRIAEAQALTERPAAASSAAYAQAFHDFDASASAGSRALTDAGTGADASALMSLRNWVTGAAQQIVALQQNLPRTAVERSAVSGDLLARIDDRVTALRQRLGCEAITSGARDDLGPLPASMPCTSPRSVNHDASVIPMPPSAPATDPGVQVARPTAPPPTGAATVLGPVAPATTTAPQTSIVDNPLVPPTMPTTRSPVRPTVTGTPPLLPLPIHLGNLPGVLGLPGIHIS